MNTPPSAPPHTTMAAPPTRLAALLSQRSGARTAPASAPAAARGAMPAEATPLAALPLGARRALLALASARHRARPFAPAALADAARGEARLAELVGLDDARLATVQRAARHLVEQGRRREARELLSFLAVAAPHDASTHLALGALALDERASALAERHFAAALACFGGDLGAHAGRALALLELGPERRDEALAEVHAALELDPEGSQPLTVRLAHALRPAG